VVPRVHTQKQAYILQNEDKRIVFVIPWMDEFSIIGTTDVEYKGDPKAVAIDDKEINYLLNVYNAHFKKTLTRDDIVWTYSGVRPLCDDESDSPQAITRDYTLDIHDENGQAPLLSVFGGKLTTYRKLAEHALEKLTPYYKGIGPAWTKTAVLPGGDIGGDRDDYAAKLRRRFPFISESMARHYARTYGSNSELDPDKATSLDDLGEISAMSFMKPSCAIWLSTNGFALDDAIWRRTKQGMWLNDEQQARISEWLAQHAGKSELSLAS
jgi:glycerol-3-phosphate dehydrogenase